MSASSKHAATKAVIQGAIQTIENEIKQRRSKPNQAIADIKIIGNVRWARRPGGRWERLCGYAEDGEEQTCMKIAQAGEEKKFCKRHKDGEDFIEDETWKVMDQYLRELLINESIPQQLAMQQSYL